MHKSKPLDADLMATAPHSSCPNYMGSAFVVVILGYKLEPTGGIEIALSDIPMSQPKSYFNTLKFVDLISEYKIVFKFNLFINKLNSSSFVWFI